MNFRGDRSGRPGVVVDVTALVDVVFQLLIFFLLTSSYVSNEAPAMDVELPEASEQNPQARELVDLTITIDAEGQLFTADGAQVGEEGLFQQMLEARRESDETVVLIRGDRQVPYGRVVQIMGLARTVGLPVNIVYDAQ